MIMNGMEMNWTDFEKLDGSHALLLIGIAPIEEHGRHLPLGVDIYETQYWIDHAAKQLLNEHPDYQIVKLPMIPYGHAKMEGFPGNIHLSQKMLYALMVETLRNVVQWGIENIVVVSGHVDPRHTIAIEQAWKKEGTVPL